MLSKWRYVGVTQVAFREYSRGTKITFGMNQTFLSFLHAAVVLWHCSAVLWWSVTLGINKCNFACFSLYLRVQPFSLQLSLVEAILVIFFVGIFACSLGSGLSSFLFNGSMATLKFFLFFKRVIFKFCTVISCMGKRPSARLVLLEAFLIMTFEQTIIYL